MPLMRLLLASCRAPRLMLPFWAAMPAIFMATEFESEVSVR